MLKQQIRLRLNVESELEEVWRQLAKKPRIKITKLYARLIARAVKTATSKPNNKSNGGDNGD